jgi:hypothetical protein
MIADCRIARSEAFRPLALLVHDASLPYVRPVVEFVRAQLSLHAGHEPLYAVCRDVAEVRVPANSVVFLVGDGFPRYARAAGCRYVFVNFSLVEKLRWWRPISSDAARWMRAKRSALLARRDQYDMVLDFHPWQTRLLEKELAPYGVRVRTFMTGVADEAAAPAMPLASRRFDVCFIGTDSPRRARMRSSLEHRGITVSPGTAPSLQSVIGDCRVVANVHFANCDTLEAPRVLHSLTAGVCLVTEPCCGLSEIAPSGCYVRVSYRSMPAAIAGLLREPARIEAIARSAGAYVRERYAERATRSWRAIVHEALAL